LNYQDLLRKIKYGIWIPKRITRKPKRTDAVISDLFPLRSDSRWDTYFELLNVSGLVSGDSSVIEGKRARFVFFNKEGIKLSEKSIPIPKFGRMTVNLNEDFDPLISQSSTFAVFHDYSEVQLDIGDSYLAERGYTGYSRKDSKIRGYVHGNFDSVAYSQGEIQAIGNKGFLPRLYTVQHPLRGPATYEFFLSNPTPKSTFIQVLHGNEGSGWKEEKTFTLPSMGSQIFKVEKTDDSPSFVRVRSKLYLGRPVVFRLTPHGFDVFHG
jgi:hypothetical protein